MKENDRKQRFLRGVAWTIYSTKSRLRDYNGTGLTTCPSLIWDLCGSLHSSCHGNPFGTDDAT